MKYLVLADNFEQYSKWLKRNRLNNEYEMVSNNTEILSGMIVFLLGDFKNNPLYARVKHLSTLTFTEANMDKKIEDALSSILFNKSTKSSDSHGMIVFLNDSDFEQVAKEFMEWMKKNVEYKEKE